MSEILFFSVFLKDGHLVTGLSKAWLGRFGEIGHPYIHPSSKQCDAAAGYHTHPASAITSGVLPVDRGGTGTTDINSLVSSIITHIGAAKIQTGTYTGTGSGGYNNKNSLTFNFAPKILCISSGIATTDNDEHGHHAILYPDIQGGMIWWYARTSGISAQYLMNVSISGNTVYWYNAIADEYPRYQLNSLNAKYYYVALG